MMVGCMNRMLKENNYSKSKGVCECVLSYLNIKYSDDKLREDTEIDKILSADSVRLSYCSDKHIDSININKDIDTTKKYYKIGLMNNFGNNKIEEIEAYVSRNNDTIINQYKIYNNGVLDSTKSKFFELVISGPKDSIMNGRIHFYSPRDTLPKEYIYQRNVSFRYIQMESDSLVIKEIDTDTNFIAFPYKNFWNFTFIGYISDLRFINKEGNVDSVDVNWEKFAIDNKKFTNNIYVELINQTFANNAYNSSLPNSSHY